MRRARGASPEHAQQERGKQRRVHEREHELQHVHDVVEPRRRISRDDAEHDPNHGRNVTHPQVVPSVFPGRMYDW